MTAFVTRSSEAKSPDLFARWPDQPADHARIVSVFERFGLPDRLD